VTSFKLDEMRREAMLKGQDQIEQTRTRDPQIAAFQKADQKRFPWLYAARQ